MTLMRSGLLWISKNTWMSRHLPRYRFVRRSVRKFMPGEEISQAIQAAEELQGHGFRIIFTHLGENISGSEEADRVVLHYIQLIDAIREYRVGADLSIKLTQIGLDLSEPQAEQRFSRLAEHAGSHDIFIWIDMEDSSYTSTTIGFYRRMREKFDHIGICLQAYLHRTADDIEALISCKPFIRLVKGAYLEPPETAIPLKKDVDHNFEHLSRRMLDHAAKGDMFPVFATHDRSIINNLCNYIVQKKWKASICEFHMLYGIQTRLQNELVRAGTKTGVLISYGHAWFAWYMRRLAERPANVAFALKNLFYR